MQKHEKILVFTFVRKERNKRFQLTRAVQSEQVLALDRVAKAEIKVQAFILGGKDGWLQIHFTSWTNIFSNCDKYNLTKGGTAKANVKCMERWKAAQRQYKQLIYMKAVIWQL